MTHKSSPKKITSEEQFENAKILELELLIDEMTNDNNLVIPIEYENPQRDKETFYTFIKNCSELVNLPIIESKTQKECDFIIKENEEIIKAIQVTKQMGENDSKTRNREIEVLIEAMKKFNLKGGLILTEDEGEKEIEEEGFKIIIKPVWRYFLEN